MSTITDEQLSKYDAGRLTFPTLFEPVKAHQLYDQYHEEYAARTRLTMTGS